MDSDQHRFGKYRLLRRIASGGMGEVHLAKLIGPSGFEKLVVIKRLLESRRAEQKFIDMFFSEARVAAQLNHSNIVQIYEVGEYDGVPYIAMEYVHGKSLRKIIDTAAVRPTSLGNKTLPAGFVVQIIAQLCRGLSFAHDARHLSGAPMELIHRDINPLNLLVSYQGEMKIIDFGIAKSELSMDQTQAGTIKGTVVYMSPEQSLGQKLDKRSDLFSVGICLYEALTGKNPFHKASLGPSLDAIRRAQAPQIDTDRPDLAPFVQILAEVLVIRPTLRLQSCNQLADRLEDLLARGVIAKPTMPLSAYMLELFHDDIGEEETALERTDLANLADLMPPPAALGQGGTAPHVFVPKVLPGQGQKERDRPVSLADLLQTGGFRERGRTSGQGPVLVLDEAQHTRADGPLPQPEEAAAPLIAAAENEDTPIPMARMLGPWVKPWSAMTHAVARLQTAVETRAPALAGWLRWGALAPGKRGGRFGLPIVSVTLLLVCAGLVARLLGGQRAAPPTDSHILAVGPQSVPITLEGETNFAPAEPTTPPAAQSLEVPADALAELTERTAPAAQPRSAAGQLSDTKRAAAARKSKESRLLPDVHPQNSARGFVSLASTMALQAEPPMAMRHNGKVVHNPIVLHPDGGLLQLSSNPAAHAFAVQIRYNIAKRDVRYVIDAKPWANVYGAGGISLGRTPLAWDHAGATTTFELRNPQNNLSQTITLRAQLAP